MYSINRLHLYILIGLWSLVHALLLVRLGIRENLYDSQVYIRAADFLVNNGNFQQFHHAFYALPILLIALLKAMHTDWVNGYLLIQCVLSGFGGLCLYRAAAVLFKDQNAGLISAIIFICWWEVIQWNTAIMTESIACSLTCFVILRFVQFRSTLKDRVIMFVLLALGVLARPTGALVIFGAFVFLATHHWRSFDSKPHLKILLPVVFTLLTFLGAIVMFQSWDFTEQYYKGNIVTYIDTIEGQKLYSESLRLDTSGLILPDPGLGPVMKTLHFIWYNPIHFVTAARLKVFYLVTGTRPYFSALHNTYSIVWLLTIYTLFVFGFCRAANKPIKYFCISLIGTNCLLVAVATVDWDNRFYVPMQPALALLAGGGGAYLYGRYLLRTGRSPLLQTDADSKEYISPGGIDP